MRSAFLIKAGLGKQAFVATGVVCAVLVDVTRLVFYGTGTLANHISTSRGLILPVTVATLCAFAGAFFGKRMLQKVTVQTVQRVVAGGIFLIGVALVMGWI